MSSGFAIGGGILSRIDGFRRPFSLDDQSIAYPRKPDIVTMEAASLACLAAPAAIILVLAFVVPKVRPSSHKRRVPSWRLKLWDANAGWMGLGLALATTLFITSGMKALVGKPRPNLLAICDADIDQLANFVVGGTTREGSDSSALVSWEICRQEDLDLLNDAFFAFPSGHSSNSWAGLLYLSLWLCARFSVAIPYLPYHLSSEDSAHDLDVVSFSHGRKAAPPLWLLALVLTPLGVALFISTSRYADHHHAGIDIFAGSVIGIISGYLSFRLYHLPVQRGYGMAWGPRDEEVAFIGDTPWHHQLTDPSTVDSRKHEHTHTSTSTEEMLDYDHGRDSVQYPMQRIPEARTDRP